MSTDSAGGSSCSASSKPQSGSSSRHRKLTGVGAQALTPTPIKPHHRRLRTTGPHLDAAAPPEDLPRAFLRRLAFVCACVRLSLSLSISLCVCVGACVHERRHHHPLPHHTSGRTRAHACTHMHTYLRTDTHSAHTHIRILTHRWRSFGRQVSRQRSASRFVCVCVCVCVCECLCACCVCCAETQKARWNENERSRLKSGNAGALARLVSPLNNRSGSR